MKFKKSVSGAMLTIMVMLMAGCYAYVDDHYRHGYYRDRYYYYDRDYPYRRYSYRYDRDYYRW